MPGPVIGKTVRRQLPQITPEGLRKVVETIAADAVAIIVRRTDAGRDVDLKPFHAYSEAYAGFRRGHVVRGSRILRRNAVPLDDGLSAYGTPIAKAKTNRGRRGMHAGTPRLRVTGRLLNGIQVLSAAATSAGARAIVGWADTSIYPIVRGLTITWRGPNKEPGPGRRFFGIEHSSDVGRLNAKAKMLVRRLLGF